MELQFEKKIGGNFSGAIFRIPPLHRLHYMI